MSWRRSLVAALGCGAAAAVLCLIHLELLLLVLSPLLAALALPHRLGGPMRAMLGLAAAFAWNFAIAAPLQPIGLGMHPAPTLISLAAICGALVGRRALRAAAVQRGRPWRAGHP